MNHSRTIQRILSGEFPLRLTSTINGTTREILYWLADGIHPPWAIVVKTSKVETDRKLVFFSQKKEALQKDVERAFGVLLRRFHILRTPCRMSDKKIAMNVLRACIVLHNMCVEDRRGQYDVLLYGQTLSDNLKDALQFSPEHSAPSVWK